MNDDFEKSMRPVSEALHKDDAGYRSSSNIHFLLYLAAVLIAALAIRAFLFEPIRVDGESMQNTLQNEERMIVEKIGYWFVQPKQGDIVIVRFPGESHEGKTYVKRVIAVGGQTIAVRRETLDDNSSHYYITIDGERLDESAYEANMLLDSNREYNEIQCVGRVLRQETVTDAYGAEHTESYYEYTVPQGYVFVMGDHRTNSSDSRIVGPVELCDVIGRVHGVIYPISSIRSVD